MIINATASSKLSELKKYTTTGDIFNRHKSSTSPSIDGVDRSKSYVDSYPQYIVYYVGGITYKDTTESDGTKTTTISYTPQGYDSPDFINYSFVKNPDKYNLVMNPKVDSDVFINRQQLSAFEMNFKLREMTSILELTTYAGGRFFNIKTV